MKAMMVNPPAAPEGRRIAGWVITLGLVILFFCLGYARGAVNIHVMNADSLYGYLLLEDLAKGGESIYWFLQPANSLFPDLLLLAVAKLLSASMDGAHTLYSALFFPLLYLSLTTFLCSSKVPLPTASLMAATVMVFALFLPQPANGLMYLYTVPAHHAGAVVVTLFAASAALREIAGPARKWRLLLSLLLIGGTFSDSILLVQLVGPLTIFLLGRLIVSQVPERRESLVLLGLIWLSASVGLALQKGMRYLPGLEQPGVRSVDFEAFESLSNFLAGLQGVIIALSPAVSLASLLGLLLAVVVLLRSTRFKVAETSGLMVLTLICWASLLGPIAAGTWRNTASIRHQLPVFFAASCLLLLAVYLVASHRRGVRRLLSAAMAVFIVVSASSLLRDFLEREPIAGLIHYKRVAEEVGITEGDFLLVDYWKAKPLLAVTGQHSCAIRENFAVFAWIMNLDWCRQGFEEWRRDQGRLLVSLKTDDAATVEAQFGRPQAVLESRAGAFFVYHWNEARQETVRQPICDSYQSTGAQARTPSFCQ